MALSCKVGTITEPAMATSQGYTGVGFQPKALIVWGDGKRTSDGAGAGAQMLLGMASGPSERFVGAIESRDGLASSDANRQLLTNAVVRAIHTGSVGDRSEADLTSFDADGFTLTWSLVNSGRLHHYMALGGDDLTNAKAGTISTNSGTGDQAFTGVGFQPDCVILLGEFFASAGSSVHALMALGGFDASGRQWAVAIDDEDNQPTTDAARIQRTDRCFVQTFNNGAIVQQGTFVSMDSDGFTINWSTASARVLGYLALKGGQFKFGSINQKTSTGTQGYTGVGFQPVGLLLASFCNAATTSAQTHARLALGAASGATARGATWYGSSDNVPDSISDSALSQTACLTMQTEGTPTENARADLDSFDADGFTLDWEFADATARQVLYLAFGSAAGGGGTDYTLEAESSSFAATGTASALKAGREVSADSGSYAFTGTAAALKIGRSVAAASGGYVISGSAATLTTTRTLSAEVSSITLSGTAASVLVGREVSADAGVYAITGTDATLTYSQNSSEYSLTTETGSVLLTSTAATLTADRILGVDSGSYALTGTNAALRIGYGLDVESGSYVLSGTVATLRLTRSLSAGSAAYVITGTAATLNYSEEVVTISGIQLTGSYTPTVSLTGSYQPSISLTGSIQQ